jgi:hypothetical protein
VLVIRSDLEVLIQRDLGKAQEHWVPTHAECQFVQSVQVHCVGKAERRTDQTNECVIGRLTRAPAHKSWQ